jgi:hypothetical protein
MAARPLEEKDATMRAFTLMAVIALTAGCWGTTALAQSKGMADQVSKSSAPLKAEATNSLRNLDGDRKMAAGALKSESATRLSDLRSSATAQSSGTPARTQDNAAINKTASTSTKSALKSNEMIRSLASAGGVMGAKTPRDSGIAKPDASTKLR